MRVLFIKQDAEHPEIIEIEDTLDALQEAVGGYIETTPIKIMISADIRMIVREEGRLADDTKANRIATYYYSGLTNQYLSKYDPRVIVGNALIVGVDGEEFTDLTDYQVHWIQMMGQPFVEWEEEEA